MFRSLRAERISLIGEAEFVASRVAAFQPNVLVSNVIRDGGPSVSGGVIAIFIVFIRRASAADGVALHAARIGGSFEHGAFRGRLAGAAGEAAFGPWLADPKAMAAARQCRARRLRKARFERHEARLRSPRFSSAFSRSPRSDECSR